MNDHYIAIGFDKIIKDLKDNALSDKAKERLAALQPALKETACVRRMEETTAAKSLLEGLGLPPLATMEGLEEALALAAAGGMLVPEQLGQVAAFAESCRRMKAYLARGEGNDAHIAPYGRSIEDLGALRGEIERCVEGERLHDGASGALRDIRRRMEHTEAGIRDKLGHILQSRKQYLADSYVTTRQGHYVVPVQRKFQGQFGGTVIEASGRGGTVFMEPAAVAKLNEQLAVLRIEEDCEERRILYMLTAEVEACRGQIRRNIEAMETLDTLFAKAKLSVAMGASPVEVSGRRAIRINSGRHPHLTAETAVPLDFEMMEGTSGVIVTGPNTGGKTVALKTVGLLSLMAQCGLHIPCGAGSHIAMQDGYWCDIGDSQDISQNLSTFSGHMTNVIGILERASRDSLVLLDELGSGTDPAEGMGIAIAVLEELRRRGCMFIVTTHYPEVKAYTERAEGVISARMAFDAVTLRPLYRLELGKTGESCALSIAKHLGLPGHLLERAHYEVYGGEAPPEPKRMKAPKSQLQRLVEQKETVDLAAKFQMGDSVELLAGGETGIVYRPADKNGVVIVQVKGVKRPVRHDRLRLRVPAAELYPPDYDFSIIFDSVEHRKARRQMGKKHQAGVSITYEEEF